MTDMTDIPSARPAARCRKMAWRWILLAVFAGASLLLAVGAGSVPIPPLKLLSALFGAGEDNTRELVVGLRLPRVALAFLTGAALAVGGTVMQSVLENPLASPFGLGVSAGAGLGATAVLVTGLSAGTLGAVLLPAAGFAGAMVTVLLVLALARALDRRVSTVTVVLIGMVASLFFSAVMDLMAAMSPEYAQRIGLWQMGSFASRGWRGPAVLAPVLAVCLGVFLSRSGQLDLLTFGDEQARSMGTEPRKNRRFLILAVAVLTGAAVSFSGIIGFVDLIAPHVARRLFGASHRRTLPAGALLGGSFMVLCDLAARTLCAPREIPIGAVTALLGAPFFLWIFFAGRERQ